MWNGAANTNDIIPKHSTIHHKERIHNIIQYTHEEIHSDSHYLVTGRKRQRPTIGHRNTEGQRRPAGDVCQRCHAAGGRQHLYPWYGDGPARHLHTEERHCCHHPQILGHGLRHPLQCCTQHPRRRPHRAGQNRHGHHHTERGRHAARRSEDCE